MSKVEKLTNDQYGGLNRIKIFLEDISQQVFILKGYAGTGKTYLIKEIVKLIESQNKNYFLAAPTGRAARILRERTKLPSSTIHKLIYSQSDTELGENEEIDEIVWKFKVRNNETDINSVFILDESSMISDTETGETELLRFGSGRLLFDILSFVGYNKSSDIPDLNRKIIFIGDPAQLPPIGSSFSAALNKEYLTREYSLNVEEYTIKETVRHIGKSGIIKASQKVRSSIDNQTYNNFKISEDLAVISDKNDFDYTWESLSDDKVVITYTNEQALIQNINIRSLFFENTEREIQPNEKFIVVSNNYHFGLMNGDFIHVISSQQEIEEIKIKLKGRVSETKLGFRKSKIKYCINDSEEVVKDVLLLENLLWSKERSLSKEELVALRVIAAMKLEVKYPSKKLKETDPLKYIQEKNEYIKALKNSIYYNALQVKFGYAVTCHKAQGGEWENVFVQFNGFENHHNEEFFRWAYTAITRAKENLYALNPPKFTPWSSLVYNIENSKGEIESESKYEKGVINTDRSTIDIPNQISGIIPTNIYFKVISKTSSAGIVIFNIQCFPWKARYLFGFKNDRVIIDFNYNKKGKIKLEIQQSDSREFENLLVELFKTFISVSVISSDRIEENFSDLFLKEFHEFMHRKFQSTNINISKIQHLQYAEKYTFSNSEEHCIIIFDYDSKKIIGKKGPRIEYSSSETFGKMVLKIISEG